MTARTLNLTVGALSLLGAILIYSAATGFPDRAALMPSLISGILGFSALSMIIKALRQPKGGESAFSNISWPKLALTSAAWFCLIILSKWINFFILSAVFLFSIALLLNGKPQDIKDTLRIAAFSIELPIALWLLFSLVLNVSFPIEGIFEF